jgi:beta-alanine degradation protein BauB
MPPPDRAAELNEERRRLLALLSALGLTDAAVAQDAAVMQPASFRVALDNEHLRVLQYRSRPGMGVCGQGVHSHPAHLTVVLHDGKVRVRNADGVTRVVQGRAGEVIWSEAETHEVENVSSATLNTLIVELKPRRG